MNIAKFSLLSGALLAFLGVAAGAFGGHALKERLAAADLAIFEVGVRYHMYHALALVALAPCMQLLGEEGLAWPVAAMVIGTFLFSCSLYCLVLTGVRWLGIITPVGGTLLLLAWLGIARAVVRSL